MNVEILAMLIPITALCIPIVAILAGHQRKMVEMRIQLERDRVGTGSADVRKLREEFQTLREGLTAHAVSVDENLKTLASRVAHLENKLSGTGGTEDSLEQRLR
ncbi:MAG: hypothetical protein HRF45_06970 [Fimbriimonadia bacterium]|jgi:hypothetical protein